MKHVATTYGHERRHDHVVIHSFEKTLSGEKYKRWTMRHNGTLEDGRSKFVTRFRFLILKIFSFQGNLRSELRHAVLL